MIPTILYNIRSSKITCFLLLLISIHTIDNINSYCKTKLPLCPFSTQLQNKEKQKEKDKNKE